jgi:hypothetical protein
MLPPDNLDKFTASPMGDKEEFKTAWERTKALYPNVTLTYIGTDGFNHYFQEHGVELAYVVPVSKNWKSSN